MPIEPGSREWKQLQEEGWVLSDEEEANLQKIVEVGRPAHPTAQEADLLEVVMSRPVSAREGSPKVRAVSLTENEYVGLQEIALAFGQERNGVGNVSGLLALIGQHRLLVVMRDANQR